MRPRNPRPAAKAPTTPTTTRPGASGMTHTRASLTIAPKIARRSYHLLNNLRPDALAPVPDIT
jgi:hypothetical protein